MDSLADSERLRAAGVPIHAVAEQETTDLEKCLYSVEAPLFVGLGFLGGRIDHHLAAMNALAQEPREAGGADRRRGSLLPLPAEFAIDLAAGTRVSLFPMAPVARARMGRAALAAPRVVPARRPDRDLERALGGRVRMAFDAPRMLVILPAALLGPVVERLRGAAGLSSASASVTETATAFVMVTRTREPGPRVRREGPQVRAGPPRCG